MWFGEKQTKNRRNSSPRRTKVSQVRKRWRLSFEHLEERTLLSHAPLILDNGTEPFVAVDPHDPANVVVGYNPHGNPLAGGGAKFSTNFGNTFGAVSTPIPINGGPYGGDPGFAVDSAGRVFFSYLVDDAGVPADLDVEVANTDFVLQNVSTSSFVVSNPDNAGNTGDHDDKEFVAADYFLDSPFRDNVYVAWREVNSEEIRFSRSTNHGASFAPSIAIATPLSAIRPGDSAVISGADPEVGPNGEVYVMYWDGGFNDGDCQGEIRVLKSTNGGVTFGPSILVSKAAGTDGLDAAQMDYDAGTSRGQLPTHSFKSEAKTQIDIEADALRSGTVYAVWETDASAIPGVKAADPANVMFSRSVDGGSQWSTPIILNDDFGTLSQFMPSISVDEQGNVVAIWYDERLSSDISDPTLAVFARVSQDGGITWSSSFQLPGSGFDPGSTNLLGDYIKVAAADGFGYAVWTQVDSAGTSDIAYTRFCLDAAFPDSFESNDSLRNAIVLGSLESVTLDDLSVHSKSDKDFFQITAHDTGLLAVNVHFAHHTGDIDVNIRDAAGNVIASSTSAGDNEQLRIPVIAQQSYFIEVFGYVDPHDGTPLDTDPLNNGGDMNCYALEIENFPAPVPTLVDLQAASDSGRTDNDDITKITTPTFDIFVDDDVLAAHLKRDEDFDVQVFNNGILLGDATFAPEKHRWTFTAAAGNLAEGHNNHLTAAVLIRDKATPQVTGRGALSDALQVTLDKLAPGLPTIGIDPGHTDTGVDGQAATFADRIATRPPVSPARRRPKALCGCTSTESLTE